MPKVQRLSSFEQQSTRAPPTHKDHRTSSSQTANLTP
uniref:Uncharacterized protein n=1 Tax=Rhizophora mucronata TaxID=61149 RepID=A0A2P2K9G6_RHIMU